MQVVDIFNLKNTCKENPYKYARTAVSKIFKEVDKKLPPGMSESHRLGNPKSAASITMEKAFKREGKIKLKILVVDCEYVRLGDQL